MNDVYVVENLNQLNVLSDPLRVLILQKLHDKPMTASQVAKLVGESPSKISYHFAELERIGIIRLGETRQKRNLIEKYYEVTAKFFTINRDLIHLAPSGLESFYRSVTTLMDATVLDLQRALGKGKMTAKDAEDCFFMHNKIRLKADQVSEFRKRLQALFNEFEASRKPDASVEAGLTLVFYTSSPDEEDIENIN